MTKSNLMTQHYINDTLSIWEIAHRWLDKNPDEYTSNLILPEVKDILRILTKAAYDCELALASQGGIVYKANIYLPSFEDFDPYFLDPESVTKNNELSDEDKYDLYEEFCKKILSKQQQACEPFQECFEKNSFDKELLNHRYLNKFPLLDYCLENDLAPPNFWFSPEEINKQTPTKVEPEAEPEPEAEKPLRKSQLDKELCRAIAQTLWDIYPDLTIEAMKKHKAIRIYANGQLYCGKNTIRDWIKEFQPNKKGGRPAKKPPVNT